VEKSKVESPESRGQESRRCQDRVRRDLVLCGPREKCRSSSPLPLGGEGAPPSRRTSSGGGTGEGVGGASPFGVTRPSCRFLSRTAFQCSGRGRGKRAAGGEARPGARSADAALKLKDSGTFEGAWLRLAIGVQSSRWSSPPGHRHP
jgi:hypothetical protein